LGRRRGGGGGDALVEEAEPAGAVDGDREADRARDEGPPAHPGPGGRGHAGLDRRQPDAGDGAERVGARALVADEAAHEVCASGETAISWRRAFSISTGYCLSFQSCPWASLRAASAKRWSA